MYILSEKEFEDVLVLHPELIEPGLTLIDRQAQLESRRTDLIFSDQNDNILLIELKKDIVTRENVEQIQDYLKRLNNKVNKKIRGMLIGQEVPIDIRLLCEEVNVEWKEIKMQELYDYLQNNNNELYDSLFIEGKLHKEAKLVPKMSFQEYLNVISPFGGPYTSYQFFKPIDASPYLSDDSKANRIVADNFIDLIIKHNFNRKIFDENIHLVRDMEKPPEWTVKAKGGAWQGYVISYTMFTSDYPEGIPCEVYIGTIGYRGNCKSTYDDEKSRFIVVRVGKGQKKVTTQYGFHKYLKTKQKALLPYYELKFNAVGLPKIYWDDIYETLNNNGYFVKDSSDKKPSKILWIGEIELDDINIEEKIGNLIESLFAVTIVKAHFKGSEKGYKFDFLNK